MNTMAISSSRVSASTRLTRSIKHVARAAKPVRLVGVVRAQFQPSPKEERTVMEQLSVFARKYDWTSTMMGSLLVTGFCWSCGQDPATALGITVGSTIVALVANELLFNDQ